MDTTHDDSLEPRADAPEPLPAPAPAPPEPAPPLPPAPGPSLTAPSPLPAPPQPAPRAPWGVLLLVTALVSALVGGAAGIGAPLLAERLRPDAGPGDGVEQTAPVEPVAAAAARAVPSVVNIDITGDAESSDALPPDHPGIPIVGSGSGVAYRATDDGGTYIVTNHHVTEKATEIVVTDSTGERYDATLVGQDPNTDIAVVRVDAVLPTIAIGDSEALEVGDLVIAIGAPFGLGHSVTAGVISAEHRSLTDNTTTPGINPLVDVIQTDAAINPGNSGGALVNRAGELVGVPTAIYSGSGTNANIGFAVTVRTVVRVADQIIDLGYVEHPFLGVQGRTVTPDFAKQEELPVEEGVYIVSTIPETEAAKSGITEGDVIVAIDSARIRTMEELLLSVRRRLVGDELTVTLYRNGERLDVPMKVGSKPEGVD